MARTRLLSPGFFLNEALCDLHPLTRILFQGLWVLADREGRLKDRPRRIKHEVLPYDDHDADRALYDLGCAGFVTRYSVNGENYIQINNFQKYQKPHQREAESSIPAPDAVGSVRHDLGSAQPGKGNVEPSPRCSVSVSVSDPVSVSDRDEQRPALARAKPRTAGGSGKNFGRVFLHRWQIDQLIDRLGELSDTFLLDEWVDGLNEKLAGKALPRDIWPWVQDEFQAEITRRSLPTAKAANGVDLELVKSLIERDGRP